MTQKHDIRKMFFAEGKSITQIKKETGYARKTIRTYINQDDWNIPVPSQNSDKAFQKLEPYKTDIIQWLNDDKNARKKQRHTAKRVFDRLKEKYKKEFNSSYRSIAGFVKMIKKDIYTETVGYLPLSHIAGEAQADFGTADFYEKGTLVAGKYLTLSFPFSNMGYTMLFKGENQECFFEGLKTIFNYIGGVPHRIWFDNASTLVRLNFEKKTRKLTDAFIHFKEHYSFEAAFCNLNSGHEKGNVENKVGYYRRNLLVPVPRFDSIKAFNKKLLLQCDQDSQRTHYKKDITIEKLFESDKNSLLKLPDSEFDVCRYEIVKTNKYGKFTINKGLHEYSVTPKYVNQKVRLKLTAFEVIVLDINMKEIIVHPRLYGNFKQQSMLWLPYLNTLSKRPAAIKYTELYQVFPDPLKKYLDSVDKSVKGKIIKTIAVLTEENGFENAVKTVESAIEYGVDDIDSLITLHHRLNDKIAKIKAVNIPDNLPILKRYVPDFQKYDKSLKGGDHQCLMNK